MNILCEQQNTANDIKKEAAGATFKDLKDKVKELGELMKEVHNTLGLLDNLSTIYCSIAREGKLDTGDEIKKKHEEAIKRWENLSSDICLLYTSDAADE